MELDSKQRWFIIGIIIAVIQPIISGLILSFAFLIEPKLRKQGKILLLITFVSIIIWTYFIEWLRSGGYF